MQTKHLRLKSGGRVTAIHAVAHSTYKGVADWYFLGDLVFSENPDGSERGAISREIPAWSLCADHSNPEAKAEIDFVMKELNDYLCARGKWLREGKHMKDGRVVHWVPTEKTGLVPL